MMRSMSEGHLTEERTQLSYHAPLFTNYVQAGHGTTTQRKAGLQLRRKVRAIEHAITTDADLKDCSAVAGWMVFTTT